MKKIFISFIVFGLLLIIVGYSINEISKSRSFQFFGEMVTSVETNEKVVALTFDDGPGKNTDEILSILKEQDVKATFYKREEKIAPILSNAHLFA